MTRAPVAAALALAAALAACASPEATRVRGQGPGADVRNVRAPGEVARMHEGADPFWRTPRLQGAGAPPLDPARQADRLSR